VIVLRFDLQRGRSPPNIQTQSGFLDSVTSTDAHWTEREGRGFVTRRHSAKVTLLGN
jgi:hypothetical protein